MVGGGLSKCADHASECEQEEPSGQVPAPTRAVRGNGIQQGQVGETNGIGLAAALENGVADRQSDHGHEQPQAVWGPEIYGE